MLHGNLYSITYIWHDEKSCADKTIYVCALNMKEAFDMANKLISPNFEIKTIQVCKIRPYYKGEL